jgi:PAS domain S-box-containing protein
MTDSENTGKLGFKVLVLSTKFWVVFAACAGIAVSFVSFMIIYTVERNETKERFYRAAESNVSLLDQGLDAYMIVLQSLAAFHDASEVITRQAFSRFVNGFLTRYPGIQALEWIPRVPASSRASYEESARRDGFPGFQITERNAHGEIALASERSEYFPVYYVEPYARNEAALGFDLASNSIRFAALSASRDTGKIVATAPITLVQETASEKGLLVFVPRYRNGAVSDSIETRRAKLTGFFLAVFRIEDLVHHCLGYHKANGIAFYLFDAAGSRGGELLHFHSSGEDSALLASTVASSRLRAGLHYEKTLRVGERNWQILCVPVSSKFSVIPGWGAWISLIGGLLFTGLVVGYIWVIQDSSVRTRSHIEEQIKLQNELEEEIAQRQRSQSVLRAFEQSMRLLIESSPIGILVARDGQYVYVNRAFVRMLGYDGPDDIIGLAVENLYSLEDIKRIKQQSRDGLEDTAVPSYHEAKVLRKSGDPFDADVWLTMIDYEGQPSILGFVTDVSEAKKLRNQLLQAQKMEALGTLAGGIAHDFNNLLTIILGYSELILSGKDGSDRDYEDLSKVIEAARTAADVIRQILAFSRKAETQPRPINLNSKVEQVRQMLSRLIPRIIDVQINLDPDLPIVNVDPPQIDQVLINLAVNARDAMPDGGTLMIETKAVLLDDAYCRCHIEAKAGPHVLLTVSDTGIGIEAASIDRIFEPFYTTKKSGQGSGLGLAMVYGIVKNHGGHITCESEPRKGTAFKIYLPAYEVEAEADVSVSGEFSALGTPTILLVDDEHVVRQLGQRILEEAGCTVFTATNGQEAVEVYREKGNQISLVILDLIMPVMDGYQCLKEILRLDPQAKVLISSGHSAAAAVKDASERGAKGFVGKPFNLKQLFKFVRYALNE